MTVLLGLPFDGASSFLRGPAEGPLAVRRVLHSGASNWTSERGIDLDPCRGDEAGWRDAGDLDIPDDPAAAVDVIRRAATGFATSEEPILAMGGDHLVTWPLIDGLVGAGRVGPLTIIHVDAHPDLYDHLDGERLSHACPFARIMESGLADRLVQFGIRTMNAHQRAQAERFGVEVHTAAEWDGRLPQVDGDVYLSVDLDGIDPAHAPGVSHHEPGGLTTRQVLGLVHRLAARPTVRLIGADVVELNPRRDVHDLTAALAAKLVKEILGALVEQTDR